MADERTITTVFRADISNFSASTQQLNRYMAQVNAEFKDSTASMGKWNDNAEGLRAKIKQLNGLHDAEAKKLSALENEYNKLTDEQKKNTKQGQQLATAILNQSAKVKETKKNIDYYTDSLKELETAGVKTRQELDELNKEIEESGESANKLNAGGVMKGVAGGIAAVGAMAVATVGSFLGLGESTREVRENFSRLETSFVGAGLSAEQANQTYNELYGVLGDTGRATEAAQQLAQMSKTEADLAANTKILTGVMATYGDSIPTEGLAEGMAATAAMGEVQGVLADALEWQGVNLDEYNEQLATLATEEERAAYIQSTLTDLYGESADAFKENNKSIIEAREAEAELAKVTAELGAIAEPIMTTLKTLAVDLLREIKPFVELIGTGLKGALEGTAGSTDILAEGLSGILITITEKATQILPTIISTLGSIIQTVLPQLITTIGETIPILITSLSSGLSQILTELGRMLPTLIPVVIDAVLLIVETLIDNLDLLIDSGISLLMGLADGLIVALPRLLDKIPVIIGKLLAALARNLPKLIDSGIEITLKLTAGIIKAIPNLLAAIPQLITSFAKGFGSYTSNMGDVGLNLVKGIWEGIVGGAKWLKDKITGFAGDVAGWFKKAFKISSPSKLAEDEIGRYIGEGVGVGILGSEKTVKKDIDHFNKSVLNGFKSPEVLAQIGVAGQNVATNNTALLEQIAAKIGGSVGNSNSTVNNFNYRFEKMETSRHALHKANLETKRILMGV